MRLLTLRFCQLLESFQKLEDLKLKPGNEHYLAALKKENVEKNRNLSILAGEKKIILFSCTCTRCILIDDDVLIIRHSKCLFRY